MPQAASKIPVPIPRAPIGVATARSTRPGRRKVASNRCSIANSPSGPMMIASSPKDMQGIVFDLHRKHYGKDGDPKILVVQAASRELNPSLRESVVARAYEADPTRAEAEYGGQFREPISAYVERSIVEKAV